MALLLAPSLVAYLPADLARWVEARAGIEGVTPDALVLVMLRGYQRIVEAADAPRAVPVVDLPRPVTPVAAIAQLAAEAVEAAARLPDAYPVPVARPTRDRACPSRPEMAALVLAAMAQLGEARIAEVVAHVEARGVALSYPQAASLLTWLVHAGQLARPGHGRYMRRDGHRVEPA